MHSWENGTRCRDGVKMLWCRSHLVWLVFEGPSPTYGALLHAMTVASFPGAEGEERAPGTHCLRMHVIIAKATW